MKKQFFQHIRDIFINNFGFLHFNIKKKKKFRF